MVLFKDFCYVCTCLSVCMWGCAHEWVSTEFRGARLLWMWLIGDWEPRQGVWGTHMVLTMDGPQNPLRSVCWPRQSCWVIRHGKQAQMFGGNSGKESDGPSCLGCSVLGLCRRFAQASMFRNLTTQSVEELTMLTFISVSFISFCTSQSYQSVIT